MVYGLAKIANSLKFCSIRNMFDFAFGNIANMGETTIWADMIIETAIDQRGLKKVPIEFTSHEKQRITAS